MKTYFLLCCFSLPVFGTSNFCNSDDNCIVKGTTCQNGLCSCGPWKVFNTNRDECLDIAPTIGSSCVDPAQCTVLISGPSVCDSREVCACSEGHVFRNNQCVRFRGYNETCTDEIPCYDGVDLFALTCKNKKCDCSEGYYDRGGVGCRPSAKANNNECFFDIDCENPDQYCKSDLVNWGPVGLCKNSILPSVSCSKNNDCKLIKNSYCDINKGICFCNDTFDYNKEKKTCIAEEPEKSKNILRQYTEKAKAPPVVIDSACDTDKNCAKISNSFCPEFRKKCTCKDGFIYSKPTGNCVLALGSTCTNEKENECGVRHSNCENNQCQCSKFFIYSPYSNKCFKPTREFNQHSCGSDENCYAFGPHATCTKAENALITTCNCQPSAKFNPKLKYCEPVETGAGQQCKNNCIDKLHSKCVDGLCKCEEHYTEDELGLRCLPDLGYACSLADGGDCKIPNADCFENSKTCECLEGYFGNGTRQCIKEMVDGKEECEFDIQCYRLLDEGGICKNRTCTCEETHTLDTQLNKCELKRTIGNSCSTKRQCRTLKNDIHLVCRNGECVCDYDFHFSEKMSLCIPSGATSTHQHILFLIVVIVSTVAFYL